MELEKLAKQIQKEFEKDGEPITWDEALDMAKMEIGAKGLTHVGRSVDSPDKPKKPRTVKISDEKKELFEKVLRIFDGNAEVLKENKLIQVKIFEKIFKIDIIEQRTPKK